MKLYMIPSCPFVHRVLMACELRGIGSELIQRVEIDLNNPPKEMLAINPSGSVPTLEFAADDGFNESLVIMEFLDSIDTPGPRLYGNSAKEIAMTKIEIEAANSQLLGPIQQALYSQGNINALRASQERIEKGWRWLDESLLRKGGTFFGGTQINAADVLLAPFLVRWTSLLKFIPNLPSPAKGSCADKYLSSIENHPALLKILPSADSLRETTRRFITPHPLLKSVIDAPRSLIGNPTNVLSAQSAALNEWTLEHDGQGQCLKAKFLFKNHSDAVNKLKWLHDTQETTDHHTSFILRDFAHIEITLVTHEPKWGVTEKDLALAKAIQAYFTEGQLP